MFEPATIEYVDSNEVERKFETTQRMVPFLEPILNGVTYPKIQFTEDPKIILDIGANHGASSLFFAEAYPKAEVFAFEPGAKNFALLEKNLAHLDGRVKLFNCGIVRDGQFTQTLYAGPNNEGEASLFPFEGITVPTEQVRVCGLQHCMTTVQRADVGVAKIDVEGSEVDVLNNVLDNCSPQVIYIEYSSTKARVQIENRLQHSYKLVIARVLSFDTGEFVYVRA